MWAEKGEEKGGGGGGWWLHACAPKPPVSVVARRHTALSKYPAPPKCLWVSGFLESYNITLRSPLILRCSSGVFGRPALGLPVSSSSRSSHGLSDWRILRLFVAEGLAVFCLIACNCAQAKQGVLNLTA